MDEFKLKDGIEIVGLGKDGELEKMIKFYNDESNESAAIVLDTIKKNDRAFYRKGLLRQNGVSRKLVAVKSPKI
ncbi:MAG: hypothetical protein ABF629_10140 [Sporolactobacillus sp.]|uniref:Uncharacterized protein n=1 Tax=Sporolactobacillus nakayamae TaxID=269670 RepID=A0A1I2UF17_9BACL|nr:hypothetical protein [Sporolactobacillus nakayamae]SFG74969.1 hypothetical protein SAMN02982927_02644 [Sporolactobacillus nakayamae]